MLALLFIACIFKKETDLAKKCVNSKCSNIYLSSLQDYNRVKRVNSSVSICGCILGHEHNITTAYKWAHCLKNNSL